MSRFEPGGYCVFRSHLADPRVEVVLFENGSKSVFLRRMLEWVYPGEQETYDDPREAVATALRIRDRWRADSGVVATLGIGYATRGEPEAEPLLGTDDELVLAAEECYRDLPKCARCGALAVRPWQSVDDPWGRDFCSMSCIDAALAESPGGSAEDDDRSVPGPP